MDNLKLAKCNYVVVTSLRPRTTHVVLITWTSAAACLRAAVRVSPTIHRFPRWYLPFRRTSLAVAISDL